MLYFPTFRKVHPVNTWALPEPAPLTIPKWYDQSVQLVQHTTTVDLGLALSTFQAIRLEPKDYTVNPAGTHPSVNLPPAFSIGSGQKIYGIGAKTRVPNCTITAGSTDVLLRGLGGVFTFPASTSVTSNVRVENLSGSQIRVTNGTLNNCLFTDLYECDIQIDTQTTGYVANTKFIRHVNHSNNPSFVWTAKIGDTQSVGNNIVWQNWLTPGNKKTAITNVKDVAVIHFDVEAPGSDGSPALDITNADTFTVWAATGTNSIGEAVKTTNVDRVGLSQVRAYSQQSGGNQVSINGATKVAQLMFETERTQVFPAGAMRTIGPERPAVSPWTWTQTNAPTAADITTIFQSIYSRTLTGIAWAAPTYLTPPTVPGGAALANTRASIQADLNSLGTVFLPAGKIVLDGPLLVGGGRRLVGAGMDQTFLVGANATINLIQLDLSLANGNKSLGPLLYATDLTLANGKNGIYMESNLGQPGTGSNEFQLTNTVLERVCIRDMAEAGFMFTNIFGLDNNHFGHVYFVNCADGFKHWAQIGGITETSMYLTYMDKSVFEDCQWIGCGRALNLITTRASGGNMLINCKIANSTAYAFRAQTYDSFDFYNCDFSNNAGDSVTGLAFASTCALMASHCRFTAGAANPAGLIDTMNVVMEGCVFARGGASSAVIRNAGGLPGMDLANPANAAEYPKGRKVFINCDLTDMPLGTMPTVLGINNNSTADPTFQNDWCRRDNGTSYNFGAMSARSVGTRLLRNAT